MSQKTVFYCDGCTRQMIQPAQLATTVGPVKATADNVIQSAQLVIATRNGELCQECLLKHAGRLIAATAGEAVRS